MVGNPEPTWPKPTHCAGSAP